MMDERKNVRGVFRGQIAKSVALHCLVLAVYAGSFYLVRKRHPFRLPGTTLGIHTLTYYAPGSRTKSDAMLARETPESPEQVARSTKANLSLKKAQLAAHAAAEAGDGSSAASGLGQGKINIATVKYFPYPEVPVPRGVNGNVVFDAVIDEHGSITRLTIEKGLSPEINEAVAAIVRTWTFQPATLDGVAVASEQELVFHYEKA